MICTFFRFSLVARNCSELPKDGLNATVSGKGRTSPPSIGKLYWGPCSKFGGKFLHAKRCPARYLQPVVSLALQEGEIEARATKQRLGVKRKS